MVRRDLVRMNWMSLAICQSNDVFCVSGFEFAILFTGL